LKLVRQTYLMYVKEVAVILDLRSIYTSGFRARICIKQVPFKELKFTVFLNLQAECEIRDACVNETLNKKIQYTTAI
jgi:hypothetical protein